MYLDARRELENEIINRNGINLKSIEKRFCSLFKQKK